MWTNGSRENCATGGFEVAGAGVYLPAPGLAMEGAIWRIPEEYGRAGLDRRRAVIPFPGPLQCAGFWGAILALQAFWPGHLGIDNLDVVRSIARVLYHGRFSEPLCLWSKMKILFPLSST